ncbi:phospholipase D-like domain-containing protein [Amycolatopsis sp. NBC_00345]|uniref:phospholipase D-like domain-containing protein n=1 Tax=Amycolatopsis sp. NBC_00345 TaxID=2975955 RepID=UPI002E25FE80
MSPVQVRGRAIRALSGAVAVLTVAALPACAATAHAGTARTLTAPAAGSGLVTEPDDQWKSVLAFISGAKTTLDMTMYELADTTAEQDLATDAQRGVKVRVILDQNREKTHNQPAFDFLSGHGVQVEWAPPGFKATHQKTITDDDTTSLVLSGNLTSRYYPTGRDFGVTDHDSADVSAIEKVFNADFADTTITPPTGSDLVWSPTNSQTSLLALINGAKTSLAIENEEMADPAVVDALAAAAQRGVDVTITMTDSSSWTKNFDTLAADGAHIGVYAQSAKLYIHAKVIITDTGKPGASAFIGSENFSDASLNGNRELGLTTTDPAILTPLTTTLDSDHTGATPWKS